MNTGMDKIFLVAFTAFIGVISTASIVVARATDQVSPSTALAYVEQDAFDSSVQAFPVESAKEVLSPEKVEATVQQLVVLTPEQLKEVIGSAIQAGLKPLPAKAQPMWKEAFSMIVAGIKLPHQVMMALPGGSMLEALGVLYLIIQYKPELIGWAVEKILTASPGIAYELATAIAKANLQIIAGAGNAILPQVPVTPEVASWVNYMMPVWLNNFAASLGF